MSDPSEGAFRQFDGFTPTTSAPAQRQQAPQQLPPQNQPSGNEPEQNNDPNNVDDYSDFWNNTPAQAPQQQQQAPQNVPQNQPTQQQQEPQSSPAEQFNQLLASQKFRAADSIDRGEIAKKMQEGDISGIEDIMENVAQQAMGTTLKMVHQMVGPMMEKVAKQAVQSSGVNMHSHLAINQLHEALPFTQKKEFAPVARQVFGQALNKSGDVAAAIDHTRKYFKHFVSGVSGDLGIESGKETEGGWHQPVDYLPEGGGNQTSPWDDALTEKG